MMLQRHDVPMVGNMLINQSNYWFDYSDCRFICVAREKWYQNKAGTVTKKSFSLKFTWFFSVSIDSFSNLFQHCWASCRAPRHPSNVKISMLHQYHATGGFFPQRRPLGNHPNKGKTPLSREGKCTPPLLEVLCVFSGLPNNPNKTWPWPPPFSPLFPSPSDTSQVWQKP